MNPVQEVLDLTVTARQEPAGPASRWLVRRALGAYALVWLMAVVVVVTRDSPRAHASVHGLLVPGGGLLYEGRPGLFAATMAAFVVAVVAWFVIGMLIAPVAVWATTLAAAVAGGPPSTTWSSVDVALPCAIAVLALIAAVAHRRAFARAQKRGRDANQRLGVTTHVAPTRWNMPARGRELSTEDLAFQRYLLDLALQPLDAFQGFEWTEFQFREGAVRYQLNYAQWGLALAQYTSTPAFKGYVAEAQRNLIEKMLDPRIWRYWRWENLWGNLRFDPDPIARDNVMLSGYYALMLGAYESNNGDHRYDEAGSLCFQDERRAYAYDFPGVAAALRENFTRSRFCLFPCEPNWVYPICNMIGMSGLLAYDRLHGAALAEPLLADFERAVNVEFCTADGQPQGIRSSRLGFRVPSLTLATGNDAGFAFWLSPILPDAARRAWVLTRERFLGIDADGLATVQFQSLPDRLDLGRMRPTWGPFAYSFLSAAAAEMGDEDMAAALQHKIAALAPPERRDGALRHPGSTTTNSMLAVGRFGGERALHDLVNHGHDESTACGPVLLAAPYPDALVARAVTDGTALELVLVPGLDARTVTLVVERLRPGATYRVEGTDEPCLVAGDDGRARIHVDLEGRRELRLHPTR